MNINATTIEKMETQLNEWGAQIKLLEAKIENTGSDIKLKRNDELEELHKKQHAAKEKLKEMKHTTNETWGQVKDTADKVWGDLKAGIAKARSNM